MGGAGAICFIILMGLAVLIFWGCGLVLSVYEIVIGSIALADANMTDYGGCNKEEAEDGVDLIPLYLIVNGIVWILWTMCSALLRCNDMERAAGFYVGSGDLKVHCMQGDRTVGRHMVRKYLANVLVVIAVAWLVAGSIFVFYGNERSTSNCAELVYQSASITLIMRWAWVAFIVLISLLLKVMQCIIQSKAPVENK
ncbi:uncharacterized protein [Watersipora subatra]|uniref:uncharacterized protein n=1 Tax=Watersipora subatra TaxID=2589382 RepID=UPI00355BB5E1